MELFFQHNLSKLKCRQDELDKWPAAGDLDKICKHAAGRFDYAAIMVGYIGCKFGNPKARLDLPLKSPELLQEEFRLKSN